MGLTKDSTMQQIESYVFTQRLILAIVTGCIAGILPHQTYFYGALIVFPLMLPLRAVTLKTSIDAQQLVRHGILQSVAGFLFGWLTMYNLHLQGVF